MRRRYYEIVKLLPPDLLYEEIEKICRREGLDPILLFILLNDKYIKEKRPDVFEEVFKIEDIEEIEDWI